MAKKLSDCRSFLDPSQAEQAQRLARFAATSDSYSPGKLAEGVTHYLRSLRERAFEHMISEKGWDIGRRNVLRITREANCRTGRLR